MDEPFDSCTFSQSLQAAATATARSTPELAESEGDQQRAEKMALLKEQIKLGQYNADAATISRKIVDQHLGSEEA